MSLWDAENGVVRRPSFRHTARMNYFFAAMVGLVSGVTSGLFGVGGGVIMVPAMVLLLKCDMKLAVATSLAVIVPTALASSVLNHTFGRIDWRLAAAMVVPAIVGGLASTWFKEQVPSEVLKRVFGGFLIVVGARLLLFK
jgi:hypothetical protein